MKEYLLAGRIPDYTSAEISNQVLISEYLAKRLEINIGDQCNTLFLREDNTIPNQRNFIVSGIYSSGFQQFDATYVFVDIRQLRQINRWTEDQTGIFEVFINKFDDMQSIGDEIYH